MFWFNGKRDVSLPGYEVSVVSVGGADSVVFEEAVSVGTAAGSGAGAAVTVTEAVGWGGWRGSIAWGRRGGKGARPGKLKEGSEAREGTVPTGKVPARVMALRSGSVRLRLGR